MPAGRLKGHIVSEDTRKKLRETHKRIGTKPPSRLGYKHSEGTKKKISIAHTGKTVSLVTRKKISAIHKGKKLSKEHKEKLSKMWSKEKCYFWKGGISFEPYSINWNESLRRSIRERDKYICQLCNKSQGDKTHSVHHIDYDKQNCDPNNLITLCCSCNSKVNKNRDYWTQYFNINGRKKL